jgi:two-component system, sensor histidine kinase YesM
VQDDGVGFTPYKLAQMREVLNDDSDQIILNEGGFGLANVNKRLKLYYGKQYGLYVQSEYLGGTQVVARIPFQNNLD